MLVQHFKSPVNHFVRILINARSQRFRDPVLLVGVKMNRYIVLSSQLSSRPASTHVKEAPPFL